MDLEIRYENGSMTVHLEEFLSERRIAKVRKLLKVIRSSFTPECEQQIMQTKHRISQIQTGVKNARFLRDSHRKNTKVWKNRNADVKKYRERLKEPRATLKEQNEELRNLKNLLWQRQKAFDCNVRNKEFYKKVMQEIT